LVFAPASLILTNCFLPLNEALCVFMNCINCKASFNLEFALSNSVFSWPEMQTIWYVCPDCNKGNHIRFNSKKVELIKSVTNNGTSWETVHDYFEPTIDVRIDSKYLHVWYNGKHFEIESRV
jgi:hypothetical protein